MKDNPIFSFYKWLLDRYGEQGWWPLLVKQNNDFIVWYHKKDYSYPKNLEQIYEICLGAILTQNTSWKNVEKALINLKINNLLNPEQIEKISEQQLAQIIKPAGFFNQKAKYLKNFTSFFLKLGQKIPTREQLLEVKGIGKETADSMLLYAWKQPHFVVDAYTKRLLPTLGIRVLNSYDKIKQIFEQNLPKDLIVYQEYHALIVEHSKQLKRQSNAKTN